MLGTTRNRIYLGLVISLCLVYVLTLALLPVTHGYPWRSIIAYSYATAKVLVFPALAWWLIYDEDKSLPWRSHPVRRHGISIIILLPVAVYFREKHPPDLRWAEIAGLGVLLSICFITSELLRKMTTRLRRM